MKRYQKHEETLLKAVLIATFDENEKVYIEEIDDKTMAVSVNGHVIHLIDKDKFPFWYENLNVFRQTSNGIAKRTIDCLQAKYDEKELKLLTRTKELRKWEGNKTAVKFIATDGSLETWIDEKKLKPVNPGFELYGFEENKPICAIDNFGKVTDIICPVRIVK